MSNLKIKVSTSVSAPAIVAPVEYVLSSAEAKNIKASATSYTASNKYSREAASTLGALLNLAYDKKGVDKFAVYTEVRTTWLAELSARDANLTSETASRAWSRCHAETGLVIPKATAAAAVRKAASRVITPEVITAKADKVKEAIKKQEAEIAKACDAGDDVTAKRLANKLAVTKDTLATHETTLAKLANAPSAEEVAAKAKAIADKAKADKARLTKACANANDARVLLWCLDNRAAIVAMMTSGVSVAA